MQFQGRPYTLPQGQHALKEGCWAAGNLKLSLSEGLQSCRTAFWLFCFHRAGLLTLSNFEIPCLSSSAEHLRALSCQTMTQFLACMLQVYDLLVACGWMAGSHTSAPSAAMQRIDGQPPPGSVVKCDPLEAQMHPVFNGSLQGFPGFHPGPFQM